MRTQTTEGAARPGEEQRKAATTLSDRFWTKAIPIWRRFGFWINLACVLWNAWQTMISKELFTRTCYVIGLIMCSMAMGIWFVTNTRAGAQTIFVRLITEDKRPN